MATTELMHQLFTTNLLSNNQHPTESELIIRTFADYVPCFSITIPSYVLYHCQDRPMELAT